MDSAKSVTDIIIGIGALAGAVTGSLALYLQIRQRRVSEYQDWQGKFKAYKKNLKPFLEMIELAYSRFIKSHSGVRQTWMEAVKEAKWPSNFPWSPEYIANLDAESKLLFDFAQAIYSKKPLKDHSILKPCEFENFHKARWEIANYFRNLPESKHFSKFLNEEFQKKNYYKVKLVAYLELVLNRALGETEDIPVKPGLFKLGIHWKQQLGEI